MEDGNAEVCSFNTRNDDRVKGIYACDARNDKGERLVDLFVETAA